MAGRLRVGLNQPASWRGRSRRNPVEDDIADSAVAAVDALAEAVAPAPTPLKLSPITSRKLSPITSRVSLQGAEFSCAFHRNRTHVLIMYGSRSEAIQRSRSPRGRSADPGGDGHVGENRSARLVGQRAAGVVGSGARRRRPAAMGQSC
jgi:hypothetical protein